MANTEPDLPDAVTAATAGRIRSFVERLERLAKAREENAADTREVFAEAKGEGYDVPALRAVLAGRAADPAKRQEQAAIVELYQSVLA